MPSSALSFLTLIYQRSVTDMPEEAGVLELCVGLFGANALRGIGRIPHLPASAVLPEAASGRRYRLRCRTIG